MDVAPADGSLVISGLTVSYNSASYTITPIDHLNLKVASGDLVLLLGASGCGKTTLLSALAAILAPSSGSIRFGGVEVTQLRGASLSSYRRDTVGIVFQAFNLIPGLSAIENVMLPMRAARVPRRAAQERAAQLLTEVGLEQRMQHKPGDLSGGQQQRVAIARSLAHDPPLLLADEPTAHLDYIQVDGVIRLLRELARPGRIVVVATHDERLMPLADGVVELSPRTTGDTGPPEEISLRPGEVLFAQGTPGDRVYMVESGAIELVRSLAGGGEDLLNVASAGDYFGELAPMFGLQRSATARARKDTVVTSYSVRDFRERVRPGSLAEIMQKTAG